MYSEREKGTEIIVAIPSNKNDYTIKDTWLKGSGERNKQLESVALKYKLDISTEEELSTDGNLTAIKPQTILVVDDNDELRNFLKESLAGKYRVVEAANGSAGLEKAREELPDLIISDVMMPIWMAMHFVKWQKKTWK